MFGGGASMAIASLWTSIGIGNWSTPTVLFCVLNIMIATIFIASNFKSPNDHDHHHNSPSQLTRSPSLLERVKSVNLSSFYASHDKYRVDDYESTTTGYNSVSQLSRAPYLLQRVKSIDLSSFSYLHKSVPTESEQLDNSTSQLTRAPSLLDRVKSFKLISPFNSDPISTTQTLAKIMIEHSNMDPHHDLVQEDHNYVTTNKSNDNELANVSSEKRGVSTVRRLRSSLLKSRSEKGMVESEEVDVDRRLPAATMRESVVHDQSVDAKADDFIKRFKNQLKLQRIDSLQRFREMLNRGT